MAILDHNSSAPAPNRCITTGLRSTEATAMAARTFRGRIKDHRRTKASPRVPRAERLSLRRNPNESLVLIQVFPD